MLERLHADHRIEHGILERHLGGVRNEVFTVWGPQPCEIDACLVEVHANSRRAALGHHPDAKSVTARHVKNAILRPQMAHRELVVIAQLVARPDPPGAADLQSLDATEHFFRPATHSGEPLG